MFLLQYSKPEGVHGQLKGSNRNLRVNTVVSKVFFPVWKNNYYIIKVGDRRLSS